MLVQSVKDVTMQKKELKLNIILEKKNFFDERIVQSNNILTSTWLVINDGLKQNQVINFFNCLQLNDFLLFQMNRTEFYCLLFS